MDKYYSIILPEGMHSGLILHFLGFFSRFEYALKRSGYVVKGVAEAKPDWDTYAGSLQSTFANVTEQSFLAAVALLKQSSPRRQIVRNGDLEWEETPQAAGESDAAYVLRMVRRVRNNLFHGGKFPSGPIADPTRNAQLLEACIIILKASLELTPQVANTFGGAVP